MVRADQGETQRAQSPRKAKGERAGQAREAPSKRKKMATADECETPEGELKGWNRSRAHRALQAEEKA